MTRCVAVSLWFKNSWPLYLRLKIVVGTLTQHSWQIHLNLYPIMPYFNLNDTLNLLSKVTARRAINAAKVWSSYRLSRLLKKPIQWGYPISVSFEPTTSCNLRCPECPSGLRAFTRPTGMLKKDFFKRTIDDIYKELTYLIFYFQGEPYLNPDFLEMVGD